MKVPSGLVPLIDGDILRYEIGFAAEAGWRAMEGHDPSSLPPFDYVADILDMRIQNIMAMCNTETAPVLYITEGRTFRYDIATVKPYKGQRQENKPWHFNNLTAYMKAVYSTKVVTGIEADDAIAIEHSKPNSNTIICSRDKDLRQVPGWFFSWELGKQPSFGPTLITNPGTLQLSSNKKKLIGTGDAFFFAQVLMGDTADNIPGCPGWGPVRVYELLNPILKDREHALGDAREETTWILADAAREAYEEEYGDEAEVRFNEQSSLCWLLREEPHESLRQPKSQTDQGEGEGTSAQDA